MDCLWGRRARGPTRSPTPSPTPSPAALGIDFGSSSSKLALAMLPRPGVRPRCTPLYRVDINAGPDDPERQRGSSHYCDYNFIAFAYFDGERLVVGPQALSKASQLPLKTIFAHRSGLPERVIRGLPGGEDLIRACTSGHITGKMEDDAILGHFENLVKIAKAHAADSDLEITKVVLSYPSYIGPHEKDEHWETYRSYYLGVVRRFFAEKVEINTISEGQATAVYVIEPFIEANGKKGRVAKMLPELRGLDHSRRLNLVVVDHGSSTLNIQSQTLYFEDDGSYRQGQSVVWDHEPGAQGGSQTMNDEIKQVLNRELKRVLNRKSKRVLLKRKLVDQEDPLESLMEEFDRKKWDYDWGGNLTLFSAQVAVNISAAEMKTVFDKAHGQGLELLESLLSKEIIPKSEGMDFAVVFCGGSYYAPRLRQAARELLGRLEIAHGSRSIAYRFLASVDTINWPSAVAAGAALSMVSLPRLQGLLRHAAIGIHIRDTGDAPFMFSPGWGPPRPAELSVSNNVRGIRAVALVCDPCYWRDSNASDEARTAFRPLWTGRPTEVFCERPAWTYELGWVERAKNLPPQTIRFEMKGKDLDFLAVPGNLKRLAKTKITFALTCRRLDKKGVKVPRDQRDRKLVITIRADPGSKLLVMHDMDEFPLWCKTCDAELEGTVRRCGKDSDVCRAHYVCETCYTEGGVGLGQAHRDHAAAEQVTIPSY